MTPAPDDKVHKISYCSNLRRYYATKIHKVGCSAMVAKYAPW